MVHMHMYCAGSGIAHMMCFDELVHCLKHHRDYCQVKLQML